MAAAAPKVEIAHVLTTDVVEYSTLLITEQTRVMAELTRIVKETPRFQRADLEGKLIRVPTGDGMMLVFFDDPQAPIECAMEIAMAIESHPDIRLRMGIHSGPVNEFIDVTIEPTWPERAWTWRSGSWIAAMLATFFCQSEWPKISRRSRAGIRISMILASAK